MPARKPLSWQWRVTIGVVVAFIAGLAVLLSPWGNEWMRGKMEEKYAEMPAEEQRDSPWADRYMTLAWWNANIRFDDATAMDLYRTFIGLRKEKVGDNKFTLGFYEFDGLCSKDGKTGWGPMHPRAPEAYWGLIEVLNSRTTTSGEFIQKEAIAFNRLFYSWMKMHAPDHKPHKNFAKYWAKIMEVFNNPQIRRGPWPADVVLNPTDAPPPPKEE
jgi:hypothetical protein